MRIFKENNDEFVDFQSYEDETKECFLDNYGMIDLTDSYLVSGNFKIELTEQETYDIFEMIQDRLR